MLYYLITNLHYIYDRSIKRETLKLIETFVDKAEDLPHMGKQFVPPMMDPVLGDYARNVPDARESEVLSLYATIINKYACTSFILYHVIAPSGLNESDNLIDKDIFLVEN
jgi:hypothetical protein